MPTSAKPTGDSSTTSRHAKSSSRIIPVIPKQLTRKPKATPQAPARPAVAEAEAETKQASSNSSAASEVESLNSAKPLPSQSSESSLGGSQAGAGAEATEEDSGRESAGRRLSDGTVKTNQASDAAEQGAHNGGKTPNGNPAKLVDIDSGLEVVTAEESAEMRQSNKTVRRSNELPPPFYPQAQSFQSTVMPQPPSAIEAAGSRGSFVFGGNEDSSAPSPIPPPSAGSWASSAGQRENGTLSPPATNTNGFSKPPMPFTPASSHSAQGSDQGSAFVRPFFPPSFVSPQQTQQFPQPSQRQWTRDRYMQSPRTNSIGSNGADASYPPAVTQFAPGPVPTYHHGNASVDSAGGMPRAAPYPMAPPFSPARAGHYHDPRSSSITDPDIPSLYALRSYTMGLLGDTAQSDCILRLPNTSDDLQDIYTHSIFVSRSPKLKLQMKQVAHAGDKSVIDVPGDAMFRDASAFHAAIRFLYGGPPIRREHLPGNLKSPKQVLAWVLSYAAAGWYLEIPEIATAGLGLAAELMLVDNVDIALEFALKAMDASAPSTNGTQDSSPLSARNLKYAPYAADFLHSTTRFILFIMTTNFEFDRTAPELPTLQRIPEELAHSPGPFTHASRQSVSNPKLQGLQLGDFQLHTSVNRTLSSVLLSLPFLILQSLFADRFMLERVSPDAREILLRAIVQEREQRRKNALNAFESMTEEQRGVQEVFKAESLLQFAEGVVVAGGEPRLVGRSAEAEQSNGPS